MNIMMVSYSYITFIKFGFMLPVKNVTCDREIITI